MIEKATSRLKIYLYSGETFIYNCHATIMLLEDIFLNIGKIIGIKTLSCNLFALYIPEADIYLSSNDDFYCLQVMLQNFAKDFDKIFFRLRYLPTSLSEMLEHDIVAFKYLFHQIKYDFVNSTIPNINSLKINECLGLVIADILQQDLHWEKKIQLNTLSRSMQKNYFSDLKMYLPITKFTLYNRMRLLISGKSELKRTIQELSKLDNIHSECFYEEKYINTLLKLPDYFVETYRCSISYPPYQSILHGIILVERLNQKDIKFISDLSKIPTVICNISQLCFITKNSSLILEISRRNGVPVNIAFRDPLVLSSFLSLIDGYYRLSEKYTFHLCTESVSPLLAQLKSLNSHGPVSEEFVLKKLREKGGNKPGTYIIRQSSYFLDQYLVDVCVAPDQVGNESGVGPDYVSLPYISTTNPLSPSSSSPPSAQYPKAQSITSSSNPVVTLIINHTRPINLKPTIIRPNTAKDTLLPSFDQQLHLPSSNHDASVIDDLNTLNELPSSYEAHQKKIHLENNPKESSGENNNNKTLQDYWFCQNSTLKFGSLKKLLNYYTRNTARFKFIRCLPPSDYDKTLCLAICRPLKQFRSQKLTLSDQLTARPNRQQLVCVTLSDLKFPKTFLTDPSCEANNGIATTKQETSSIPKYYHNAALSIGSSSFYHTHDARKENATNVLVANLARSNGLISNIVWNKDSANDVPVSLKFIPVFSSIRAANQAENTDLCYKSVQKPLSYTTLNSKSQSVEQGNTSWFRSLANGNFSDIPENVVVCSKNSNDTNFFNIPKTSNLKNLKKTSDGALDLSHILKMINSFAFLNDPTLIKIYAICMDPFMLITEPMDLGPWDTFLQTYQTTTQNITQTTIYPPGNNSLSVDNKNNTNIEKPPSNVADNIHPGQNQSFDYAVGICEILEACCTIAKALWYLEDQHLCHGQIRARNIYVYSKTGSPSPSSINTNSNESTKNELPPLPPRPPGHPSASTYDTNSSQPPLNVKNSSNAGRTFGVKLCDPLLVTCHNHTYNHLTRDHSPCPLSPLIPKTSANLSVGKGLHSNSYVKNLIRKSSITSASQNYRDFCLNRFLKDHGKYQTDHRLIHSPFYNFAQASAHDSTKGDQSKQPIDENLPLDQHTFLSQNNDDLTHFDSSLPWTAPELFDHPKINLSPTYDTKTSFLDIQSSVTGPTHANDVWSFGTTVWESLTYCSVNPFAALLSPTGLHDDPLGHKRFNTNDGEKLTGLAPLTPCDPLSHNSALNDNLTGTIPNSPYFPFQIEEELYQKFIMQGKRLPQPDNCPKPLYNLLLKTWNANVLLRIKIHELVRDIHQIYHYTLNARTKLVQDRAILNKQFHFSNQLGTMSAPSKAPHATLPKVLADSSFEGDDGYTLPYEIHQRDTNETGEDTDFYFNHPIGAFDKNRKIKILRESKKDKIKKSDHSSVIKTSLKGRVARSDTTELTDLGTLYTTHADEICEPIGIKNAPSPKTVDDSSERIDGKGPNLTNFLVRIDHDDDDDSDQKGAMVNNAFGKNKNASYKDSKFLPPPEDGIPWSYAKAFAESCFLNTKDSAMDQNKQELIKNGASQNHMTISPNAQNLHPVTPMARQKPQNPYLVNLDDDILTHQGQTYNQLSQKHLNDPLSVHTNHYFSTNPEELGPYQKRIKNALQHQSFPDLLYNHATDYYASEHENEELGSTTKINSHSFTKIDGGVKSNIELFRHSTPPNSSIMVDSLANEFDLFKDRPKVQFKFDNSDLIDLKLNFGGSGYLKIYNKQLDSNHIDKSPYIRPSSVPALKLDDHENITNRYLTPGPITPNNFSPTNLLPPTPVMLTEHSTNLDDYNISLSNRLLSQSPGYDKHPRGIFGFAKLLGALVKHKSLPKKGEITHSTDKRPNRYSKLRNFLNITDKIEPNSRPFKGVATPLTKNLNGYLPINTALLSPPLTNESSACSNINNNLLSPFPSLTLGTVASSKTNGDLKNDPQIDQSDKSKLPYDRFVIKESEITYLRKLGEGNFGEVWLGEWTHAKTSSNAIIHKKIKVAVKTYKPQPFTQKRHQGNYRSMSDQYLLRDDESLSYFHSSMASDRDNDVFANPSTMPYDERSRRKNDFDNEIYIMKKLTGPYNLPHPNLVQIKGIIENYPMRKLVMEYMELGSLDAYLRTFQVDPHLKMKYIVDIVEGMDYLNNVLGIVHRDLAARNVLVANDGRSVKIADFGLAALLSKPHLQTSATKKSSKWGNIITRRGKSSLRDLIDLSNNHAFDGGGDKDSLNNNTEETDYYYQIYGSGLDPSYARRGSFYNAYYESQTGGREFPLCWFAPECFPPSVLRTPDIISRDNANTTTTGTTPSTNHSCHLIGPENLTATVYTSSQSAGERSIKLSPYTGGYVLFGNASTQNHKSPTKLPQISRKTLQICPKTRISTSNKHAWSLNGLTPNHKSKSVPNLHDVPPRLIAENEIHYHLSSKDLGGNLYKNYPPSEYQNEGMDQQSFNGNYAQMSPTLRVNQKPLPAPNKRVLFTQKSDIWSFGVTCWEIWSNGINPLKIVVRQLMLKHFTETNLLQSNEPNFEAAIYQRDADQFLAQMNPQKFVRGLHNLLIVDGWRLPQPVQCPSEFYSMLINDCWHLSSQNRISFPRLKEKLCRMYIEAK